MEYLNLYLIGLLVFVFLAETTLSELLLEEKVKRLALDVHRMNYVQLNSDKYFTYVDTDVKNYSAIVLFVALGKDYKCEVCHVIHAEFMTAAYSWKHYRHHSNDLFFMVLDVANGKEPFEKLKMQYLPNVIHFPANADPSAAKIMTIQSLGIETESILKWASNEMHIKKIPLVKIINYYDLFAKVAIVAVIFGGIIWVQLKFGLFNNSYLWCAVALIYTCTMLSGFMYNKIAGTQYAGHTIFAPGQRSQYVLESYAVAVMYFVSSASVIMMIESGLLKNKNLASVLALVSTVVYVVVYSSFLSILRQKSGFYPYSLLFK